MALTSGAPRLSHSKTIRCNNIWFKKWCRMPISHKVPLPTYMKKLLIYYPKSLHALKPVTMQALKRPIQKNAPNFTREWRIIIKSIFTRYKAEFFKHMDIDLPVNKFMMRRIFNTLHSLKIHQFFTLKGQCKLYIQKFIRENKRLTIATASSEAICPLMMVQGLQALRGLKIINIHNLPFLSVECCRALVNSLGNSLEFLTIWGGIDEHYKKNKDHFLSILHILFDFPNLKQFQYDAQVPEGLNVDLIQFDKLHARNVSFDIRMVHNWETLEFSQTNAESLEDLDFLGINTKKEWLSLSSNWDKVQDEHLKRQKSSKKLLFLNLFQMKDFLDLTNLFQTCRNISTLDLIISELNPVLIDFRGLQNLHNLQHLFLQFHSYDYLVENLFSSLLICAKKYRNFKTLVMGYFSGVMLHDFKNIIPFFEECSEMLETFIVQFSVLLGQPFGIDHFYRAMEKLKSPKTLGILVSGLGFRLSDFEEVFASHSENLETLLDNKQALDTLHFVTPHMSPKDVRFNFEGVKGLKRIGFGLPFKEPDSSVLEEILQLSTLRFLEIGFPEQSEQEWCHIVKKLKVLKNLEIVRLREIKGFVENGFPDLTHQLEVFIKRHPKLEYIFFKKEDDLQILLCTQEYYMKEVDVSLWMKHQIK